MTKFLIPMCLFLMLVGILTVLGRGAQTNEPITLRRQLVMQDTEWFKVFCDSRGNEFVVVTSESAVNGSQPAIAAVPGGCR